MHTLGWLCED